jgi:hypothetical protein
LAKIKENSSAREGEKAFQNAFNNKTTPEIGRIVEYSIFTIVSDPASE